jgi:hypothetical protein
MKPTRSRWIRSVLLVSLGGLSVVVAVVAMWPPAPGISVANFRRLHAGMTENEVQEILGARGDVDFRCTGNYWRHWSSTDGAISIRFNAILHGHRKQPDVMEGTMYMPDGRKLALRSDPSETRRWACEWIRWKAGL